MATDTRTSDDPPASDPGRSAGASKDGGDNPGPAAGETLGGAERQKARAGEALDATSDASNSPTSKAPFPIVGIGASAGGLDAFQRLLQHLPADGGLAYVLVQHLNPSHSSLLVDLLSAATAMPVLEVQDGLRVERDHVYVIAPNCTLAIHHRHLQVLERVLEGGRHLPVDYLLRTLSEDLGTQAIGVILSGTASDGTLGLQAVKAAGGITFAQDESSAEYFGMPGSAIAAGSVDFVLPPEEIAKQIARIAHHPYLLRLGPEDVRESTDSGDNLAKIFMLLRSHTGNDFTYYKRNTIFRRIKRRMAVHKLERLVDYVRYLQSNPVEVERLFDDLLINVTGFFREPDSFEALREKVFPRIFDGRRSGSTLRIWVPGCSTGEEAYSLAMAMVEYLGDRGLGIPIQIFATDIDGKAIEKARIGMYSEHIAGKMSPDRLRRFFQKATTAYRISKSVRDMCVFAVQNLIKDPPFSRLDLICCRNLLIYLSSPLQKRVLQLFHYALESDGFLLLGASESIGEQAELFSAVDKKTKIYRKKTDVRRNYAFTARVFEPSGAAPIAPAPSAGGEMQDVGSTANQLILSRYGPPGVVIGRDLEILHFCGETGPYLSLVPGTPSFHLLKMARRELTVDLRTAVYKALKHGGEVSSGDVRYRRDGSEGCVNIRIVPMVGRGESETPLLVLFEEVDSTGEVGPGSSVETAGARGSVVDMRVETLERQLASTREYMQSIIEAQDVTNEELKSANEEIQSTNEEFQSINEELETAKEELQSANEELATVNDELESRNMELRVVNSDLTNLVSSVELPIMILGQDLRIRQFTPRAEKLLNLIASDLGRPISNINANIDIPELETRVLAVIEDMRAQDIELQDKAGHWYSVRMRPYRTVDNRIDGAVLVFIDVDGIKDAERLRNALAQERRLATVVRDANDPVTVQDFEGRIMAWNPAAERVYGYSAQQASTLGIERLVPKDILKAHLEVTERLRRGEEVHPFVSERVTADARRIRILFSATALLDETGKPYAIATTERKLSGR